MEKLENELKSKILKAKNNDASILNDEYLDNLYSVYPFNKFEFIISHLIAGGVISLQEYLEIRNSYLQRNKYLYVFEITYREVLGKLGLKDISTKLFQNCKDHLHNLIKIIQDNMIFGIRV